jgi:uncharacterized protein with ParB-like and HNH nuclease domain
MAVLPSRLSTETPFFQDLISDIKRGQIKIPQFQRKFVWKEEQAFKLLDSVKNNYPIGSLLIWRTGVKLAAERNIGNFQLPQTDDMLPTDYVLDGQQRITVIYSSIWSVLSSLCLMRRSPRRNCWISRRCWAPCSGGK